MRPVEHYLEAERHLELYALGDHMSVDLQLAQIHAMLATVDVHHWQRTEVERIESSVVGRPTGDTEGRDVE